MRAGAHFVLRAAARLYMPLIALFALSLFAPRVAGGGVGLIAGMALALGLALHVLVFGANAARAAFPGPLARVLLGLGLIGAMIGAGAPGLPYAARIVEAGLFMLTVGGLSLTFAALVARAPTLRDGDL